jgi:hypothetical protein
MMVILVGCGIKNSLVYIFIIKINSTMNKEALEKIFYFLEAKEEHNVPFMWKHINNIPLTEEELNIKGNLDLRLSRITSLPKGLKVDGDLNLGYTILTSLPEGLEVGGNLFLTISKITSLPKGLKVGGNLYWAADTLKDYKAWEIRNMVKPGGFIKGKIIKR